MEREHSFQAEPRQAVKDNSLLIRQLWCQLWMPHGAENASLTPSWLCGSSVDITSQEQELRQVQMDAQICHLEMKAKSVKVVYKSNVIFLGLLIRKENTKGLY